MNRVKRPLRTMAAVAALCGFCAILAGCKDTTPGLTDNPPPKGGPPASARRPPGEVNNPNTR